MKFSLKPYSIICAMASMALFTVVMPTVWAGEVEDFVDRVKTHYQHAPSPKAFSFNYHYLNRQYWDYQAPDRYLSVRMVEVDLEKKHFYDNDILHLSGGLILDRVQFQNDTESFSYERNGSTKGKGILDKGMNNFDNFMGHNVMNIDFLAVRPLLEETNIKENITLQQDKISGNIILTHKVSDKNIIDYAFSKDPLQLVRINDKSKRAKFVYDDYQTTDGITFARSVLKYYGAVTQPSFISRNDQFNIIEKIDPVKLKVPQGYGPELPKGDGILVSEEIAPDLYLVTDSSASRNSLFKVNGDEIMLFGASGHPAHAEKMIKLILEKFPNKKITSVYVTHPHRAQISGLQAYAKRDIMILADTYTIAAIKANPRFADDITTFKFQTIEHNQIIAGARFYVLENTHSKRQSFVYFKDSGIIFQAHFLHIAFDNTIAKVIPNYTRTFIDFVRSQQLKISRIVAYNRNNNISVEVMNKTYDALM